MCTTAGVTNFTTRLTMLNSWSRVSTSRANAAYSDSRCAENGDAVGAGLELATPLEAVARSASWALAGIAEIPANSKVNRNGAWMRGVMGQAPETAVVINDSTI